MAKKHKVCIIGAEGWGSAIATAVGNNVVRVGFDNRVHIYVYDELVRSNYLSEVINEHHENVKYLPGIKLPENVIAINDLLEAAEYADILIFAMPQDFVKSYCNMLAGNIKSSAFAISLVKGFERISDGDIVLYSHAISKQLNIPCYSMMCANSCMEMAQGKLCEITIGCDNAAHGKLLTNVFQTNNCKVVTMDDVDGVELCGTLKDIIALGAGLVDGLRLGDNARVAALHLGIKEMMRFIKGFYPNTKLSTFFESCGIAHSVASSYVDKNVMFAKNFVTSGKTIQELEANLMNGRKLLGPLVAEEVHDFLVKEKKENQFPLFTSIHRICQNEWPPDSIVDALRHHPDLSSSSIAKVLTTVHKENDERSKRTGVANDINEAMASNNFKRAETLWTPFYVSENLAAAEERKKLGALKATGMDSLDNEGTWQSEPKIVAEEADQKAPKTAQAIGSMNNDPKYIETTIWIKDLPKKGGDSVRNLSSKDQSSDQEESLDFNKSLDVSEIVSKDKTTTSELSDENEWSDKVDMQRIWNIQHQPLMSANEDGEKPIPKLIEKHMRPQATIYSFRSIKIKGENLIKPTKPVVTQEVQITSEIEPKSPIENEHTEKNIRGTTEYLQSIVQKQKEDELPITKEEPEKPTNPQAIQFNESEKMELDQDNSHMMELDHDKAHMTAASNEESFESTTSTSTFNPESTEISKNSYDNDFWGLQMAYDEGQLHSPIGDISRKKLLMSMENENERAKMKDGTQGENLYINEDDCEKISPEDRVTKMPKWLRAYVDPSNESNSMVVMENSSEAPANRINVKKPDDGKKNLASKDEGWQWTNYKEEIDDDHEYIDERLRTLENRIDAERPTKGKPLNKPKGTLPLGTPISFSDEVPEETKPDYLPQPVYDKFQKLPPKSKPPMEDKEPDYLARPVYDKFIGVSKSAKTSAQAVKQQETQEQIEEATSTKQTKPASPQTAEPSKQAQVATPVKQKEPQTEPTPTPPTAEQTEQVEMSEKSEKPAPESVDADDNLSRITQTLHRIMRKGQRTLTYRKDKIDNVIKETTTDIEYKGDNPYSKGPDLTEDAEDAFEHDTDDHAETTQRSSHHRKIIIKPPLQPPINPRVRTPRPPFDGRDHEYHTLAFRGPPNLERSFMSLKRVRVPMPSSWTGEKSFSHSHSPSSLPSIRHLPARSSTPTIHMRGGSSLIRVICAAQLGLLAAFYARYTSREDNSEN